jgi:hypothetical protein
LALSKYRQEGESDTPEKTRILLCWDEQSSEDGWFAAVERRDQDGNWYHHADSQKAWFPVDVYAFAQNAEEQLKAALLEAFPGAEFR